MSGKSGAGRFPIGIDLRSETTRGVVVDSSYGYVLDIGGDPAVPTLLGIGESGFSVGDEVAESDGSAIMPLPYRNDIPRTEDFNGISQADALPLAVYLRGLRETWEGQGGEPDLHLTPTGETSMEQETMSLDDGTEPEMTTEPEGSNEEVSEGDTPDEQPTSGEGDSSGESEAEQELAVSWGDFDVPGIDPSNPDQQRYGPTTITVPAKYSIEDIEQVEEAARAAGYEDVRAIPNPVAVAATEIPDCTSETVFAVADIGRSEASLGIVSCSETGQLNVEALSGIGDLGRRAIDRKLAEWILDQVAQEQDATLQFDDDALGRVREAAHRTLAEVSEDHVEESAVGVTLELDQGVDVVDGGWFGQATLPIDVEVTLHDCYEALAEHLRTIQEELRTLFDATDYSMGDVDELVVAGAGTRPVPVVHAIENELEQRSKGPALGDRETGPAIGAALLSRKRDGGPSAVSITTYDKTAEIRAMGESGPTFRPITAPGVGPGNESQLQLQTAAEDQLSGAFELWYRHEVTGERTHVATYVCSNIPASSEDTELVVDFEHGDRQLDPDAESTAVVSITATGEPDRSNPVTVNEADDPTSPWLLHSGIDVSTVPDSDGDDLSYVDTRHDSTRATESIPVEGLIESVHTVRNKLWNRAVKEDKELEIDELRILVEELDGKLAAHGMEIIAPEVGASLDPTRHRAIATRTSDRESGTILEVERPGLLIEDVVIDEAAVVVVE